MWQIFLLLMAIFNIAGDVLSKQWSVHPRFSLLAASVVAYLLTNAAWLLSLKYGVGLARGISILAIVTAITAILIGVLVYKEETSPTQAAGIILGIFALILIFWQDIIKI
jgi:multidrug transporter EmrE-like cation transporter